MKHKILSIVGLCAIALFAFSLLVPAEGRAGEKPEVFVQMGHSGKPQCIAVSPDGLFMLSGGFDTTIKLWDVATGREIWTFRGHKGPVNSLDFSPDGRYAASASSDHTAKIWDLSGLRETATFTLPNEVAAVAFSRDGRQLLTAAGDIRLWDIATGQRMKRLFWGEKRANALSFSPSGAQVASAGSSGTIIWDFAAGEEIRRFGKEAFSVAFSPDGRSLLTADGNPVIWDAGLGKEVKRFQGGACGFHQAVFSTDGRYILAAGRMPRTEENHEICMAAWEASSGAQLWSKANIMEPVAVGSDGRTAFSSLGEHDLMLWDLQTGRERRPFLGQRQSIESAAFSPDGRLAAIGYKSGLVKLWDVRQGRIEWSLQGHNGDNEVMSIAFSPDGKSLLSAGSDGTARVRDAATGNQLRKFLGHPVYSVRFGPEDLQAVSAGQEGVKIWKVFSRPPGKTTGKYAEDNSVKVLKKFGDYSYSAALSPDGRLAVSGGENGTLLLWDAASGRELKSFKGHTGHVFSVAFSRDGRLVLSGSADKALRLWDVNSGSELRVFTGHSNIVNSVAFSPDGKQALSGSSDKTARLWDTATGTQLKVFNGHGEDVNWVDFSPDGRSFASASSDSTIKLWDIASGGEVRTYKGHSHIVYSVAFSPDGRLIASGSEDRTIRIWDAATGKEVQKFPQREIVIAVSFSSDSRYVISGQGDTIHVWDLAAATRMDGMIFWTQRWNFMEAAFSPNGKYVLAGGGYGYSYTNHNNLKLWEVSSGSEWHLPGSLGAIRNVGFTRDGRYAVSSSPGELKVWDLATLKEARELPGGSALALSPDGRQYLSANEKGFSTGHVTDDYTIRLRDLATGKELKELASGARVSSLAFSPDGRYGLSGDWGGILRLFDIAAGKEVWNVKEPERFTAAAFSPDGRYVIASSWSGATWIREVSSGAEVCMIMGFGDGEWVVITPEGFFTASKNGPSHINVRMGNRVFGLDQLYDVFYRPDLVEAKINGENITALASANLEEALKNPPPLVEIKEIKESGDKKLTARYSVKSTGGGIGEVRLFHNGKLVQSDGFYRQAKSAPGGAGTLLASNTRAIKDEMRSVEIRGRGDTNFSLIDTRPKGDTFEGTLTVDSIAGVNEIGLAAFNRNNTVQSILKSAEFKSDRKPEVTHIYILSIGIDEYLSARDNLKYAVKDAQDIAGKLREQFATRFTPEKNYSYIHVKTLSNTEAVKSNIMNAVSELSQVIRPGDIFVFFIASHGVIQSGLYSIVTHDYNGYLNEGNVINSNEIMEISRKIRALTQFFILDTCHAGGLDNFISGLYDARMTVLARNMGLHMFASASSTQEALDGYKGNGMFTHVLLEALNNNKQADRNGDRIVSIYELGAYAGQMTKKYSTEAGHTQTPVINDFGRDVGVYLLK